MGMQKTSHVMLRSEATTARSVPRGRIRWPKVAGRLNALHTGSSRPPVLTADGEHTLEQHVKARR